MKKKIVSLTLAIAMCFSLLTFAAPVAGAVDGDRYVYVPEPTLLDSLVTTLEPALADYFGAGVAGEGIKFISDNQFTTYGEVSPEELYAIAYTYNNDLLKILYRGVDMDWNDGFFTRAAVTEIPSLGIMRLVDDRTGDYIVDANGNFPFAYVKGDTQANDSTVFNPQNKWIRLDSTSNLSGVVLLSEVELARMCADLNNFGTDCSLYGSGDFYFIKKDKQSFYANFAGKPYVATRGPSAADTVRPPVTEDNVVIEDNSGLVIDKAEGILNLIGQLGDQYQLNIDNLEFDFGTNSYTVNAYNKEGDIYNYYTYEVTYNITNTYITYIGSNDAYEREEYELYYQLPDGRSSADLTAEEVAGMSFEFYDVVNYERSTDDISVQALYHFDGTIEDSSYFSGLTDGFKWVTNASITYMDAGEPFGGALYLDERAHEFTIDLPEDIMTNNFTLTFRY